MKQKINILIHPTYDYKTNLDITKLVDLLDALYSKYEINNIEISGKEISILSDFYLDFLCKLLQAYNDNVHIVTNLEKTKPAIINNFNNIIVPINFLDLSQTVKNNIKALNNSKNIIVTSYDIFCKNNKKQNIIELNNLHIKSWKILPYISNKINVDFKSSDYSNYEQLIMEYLNLTSYMKFAFINKLEIDNIINNDNYNTVNVLITPNNKYALIEYDKNNKEIYKEYDSIEDLHTAILLYINAINIKCKNCKFKNKCLSNFYNLNYVGNTCSGFRNLL